ncbi:MAG: molybdopterin-dependent oxidoreductase [Nocardioides sp.]|nr:molybdopterin-dependent oxidoreductase [Nocardioides sp.]
MRNRLPYAFFGVLATLVGMAAGHLVASLLNPASSPVLAVGSTVIDATPTPMKEWAIRNFGTADKLILIGSVVIVVLILAAVAGIVSRTRFRVGAGILVLLVAVATLAAVLRPSAGVTDAVPGVVTAVAGVATLLLLHRSRRGVSLMGTEKNDGQSTSTRVDAPVPDGSRPATTRRTVLVVSGVSLAVAAVMGGAGRLIGTFRTRPEDIALPAATSPAPALPDGLDDMVPGISPFRTSNADFYRVDTRLDVPALSTDSWSLSIGGDVDEEIELSFDDIVKMDMIERDITMTCVSNSVGGKFIGSATWLGVPLQDLFDLAGMSSSKADQIFATDYDGMTISTPLELALDGRDAMLAIGMNGEALPREHGFPARVIIPGLYGFISATKWVTKLELTTYAKDTAYWTERDWATDAPIRISSRIDTPKPFEAIAAGGFVGGVAWAQQNGGVATVQVSFDGGQWTDAMLGPSAGNDYWRQWYAPFEGETGQHRVRSRVIDGNGAMQDTMRREPFPSGSSGIPEIIFTVT